MKMRLSAWLALLALALGHASRENAAQFGPGGCVSAWLSESKSCVVQTSCAKHIAQLASYALRLVCVGGDGGRVLHSFQEGTFDAEETFDTHITCQRCDSGDDVEPVEPTAGAVTVNASELHGLEEEVKLLKSSMVNMAKVVTQLKLQVTDSARVRGPLPGPQGLRGSTVTTVASPEVPQVPNVTALPVLHAPVPQVPNVTALPVLHAPVPQVPNVTALPVLHAPEINTTFFLREALAASANGTTSTTRSAAAAPMRAASGTSGALSPAAALRTLRKRGASFLGLDRSDSLDPTARAAIAASVAAAQKEAEDAALQAEKDAEAADTAAADTKA